MTDPIFHQPFAKSENEELKYRNRALNYSLGRAIKIIEGLDKTLAEERRRSDVMYHELLNWKGLAQRKHQRVLRLYLWSKKK